MGEAFARRSSCSSRIPGGAVLAVAPFFHRHAPAGRLKSGAADWRFVATKRAFVAGGDFTA
jgi:hypothetical protein